MEISNKELKLTPKRIEALHQLGIYDVDALLSYYPFRYEIIKQSAFSTWKEKDKVHFEGEIVSPIRSWRFGRKKTGTKFDVMVDDQILHITIFNRPWAKQLKEGQIITISGIYQGKNAVTAINYQAKPIAEIPTITPVYASKAGIQQRTIRDSIAKVFAHEKGHLLDFVPTSLQEKYQLLKKEEAIAKIHFPSDEKEDETKRKSQWIISEPKTKAGRRDIPMTEEAYMILIRQRERWKKRKVLSLEFGNYVFLSENGIPISNSTYNSVLKKLCKQFRLRSISPHMLRHTFATRCIEAGMNPKTLQAILGHSSIKMTLDLYVHVTQDHIQKEMSEVQNKLKVV